MSKEKEVKSGLIENEVVVKAPVVKDVPVAQEEKVEYVPSSPGHATRAYRSK
jgi:hypothetical protein